MALVDTLQNDHGDFLQQAPSKSWQFVNIVAPDQAKEANVRKFVRSNATRECRRQQRAEALTKHAPKTSVSIRQPTVVIREIQDLDEADNAVNEAPTKALPVIQQTQPVSRNVLSPTRNARSYSQTALRREASAYPLRLIEVLEEMQKVTSISIQEVDEGIRGIRQGVPSIGLSEQCVKVLCNRVRDKTDICRALSIRRMPGADPLATFNATRSNLNADASPTLNHFVASMACRSLLMTSDKNNSAVAQDWLPHAMQHPEMFLATLNFATVHVDAIAGSFWNPGNKKVLHQKAALMKQINSCLGDTASALTESTISGVALLTISEVLDSNYENACIHMNALQRMIKLRSGLQELWFGQVIHMFLSWLHVVYAGSIAELPTMALSPWCLLVRGTISPTDSSVIALGLPPDLTAKMYVSFNNLRRLSLQVERLPQPRIAFLPCSMHLLKASTKEKLQSLSPLPRTISAMTNLHYVAEVYRLAALIYADLLPYPSQDACDKLVDLKYEFITLLKTQERASLSASFEPADPQDCKQKLVIATWTLVVASLLASCEEEEDWFANLIARSVRKFALKTWQSMVSELKLICWTESFHTEKVKRIWAKVERINGAHGLKAEEAPVE